MEDNQVLQDPNALIDASAAPVSTADQVIEFIQAGGAFMYIIILILVFGLVIALYKFYKLYMKDDVDGASFMNELQRYVLSNDVQGAIRVCSGSKAALPKVLKSGLKRSTQNLEQVQNAVDATALEVIPKVESGLPYITLFANVATLLGLLGTIWGLIESFKAVAAADPQDKAELLSAGISTAMNTTFAGLTAAIILMLVHAVLSGKAQKIIAQIDEFSVKLLDLIGTKNETNKSE